MSTDDDAALRSAAISHVETLALTNPDGVIPWARIAQGFTFREQRLSLATLPRGIFWPTQLATGALTIKTSVPRAGRVARYSDEQIGSSAAWFEYRYQDAGPMGRDNRRLRQCLELQLPVPYFYGVSPGNYRRILCYVIGDDPVRRVFHVAPVEAAAMSADPILRQAFLLRFDKNYTIGTIRKRLHQDRFRTAVLEAYQERCAICHLRRAVLLDAAHIIPDHEPLGEAMVPNGLALCKLHHAAFDSDLLGINPDLEIQLAPSVMTEKDGPMLEHGLRGFHGKRLADPTDAIHRPDRGLIDLRYQRFRKAS